MIYIYDHLEINIVCILLITIVQYICSYVYHTQYMYIYIYPTLWFIHIKKNIKSFCKENDDDDNNEFKKKSLQTSIKKCLLLIP